MKEEIIALISNMNENQLGHVLDYAVNEYEEENFEETTLDLLKVMMNNNVILLLKRALGNRADFSDEAMQIFNEEAEKIFIR